MLPRQEAAPASRYNAAEKLNANTSPCLNGPEIRPGKNVLPVNVATLAGGRACSTPGGISSPIGL